MKITTVRAVMVALMLCPLLGAAESMRTKQQSATSSSYWVFGIGSVDCGKLMSDLRTNRSSRETFFESYFTGFLTGANFRAGVGGTGPTDVGKGTSPEALLAAVEQYCGNHPLDTVANALEDVYTQLRKK
jgi:hypothetical protein